MLLHGLAQGLVGAGPALTILGAIVGLGFLFLWINALIEAERG
jgi:hypothetical protein